MSNKKPNKILITGPLGHVGSRLIRNLDKSFFNGEVILIDNLESQCFPSLYNLPRGLKFKFFKEDILAVNFNKHLKNVDVVIHLAAITNAEKSHQIPKEVEAVNFKGLKRVADACLKHKVKIFFPSSTSVYGSQDTMVDEDCKELIPQSPYADTKIKSEKYLKKLGKKGLKFIVCRFGTIFGHSIGMRYDTAVNKFTWQAATGLPITVWKTAWKQKRPYLYLGDCVRAINFVIKKDLFNNEIYNVLTSNFTVEDVVKTIKKFAPKLVVAYVNSPIMNQLSYEVNDSKFRNLGFRSAGNLKKGINETINSLKSII